MNRRDVLVYGAAAALVRTPAMAKDDDLTSLARAAYIYVSPLIEMAAARGRLMAGGGAQNVLYARRNLADHTTRNVTSPNNDTLYSSAWIDLTGGPVTVTLPPSGRRYVSLQLMDMYTNSFVVLGTRTTGNDGGTFVLIGPGAAAPSGQLNIVRSPTPSVWALVRVLVDGADDLDAARQIQSGITLTGPRVDRKPAPAINPVATDWADYFTAANGLLAAEPPPATDRAILNRIARLLVGPDKTFDATAFDGAQRAAIAAGVGAARDFLIDPRHRGIPVEGWLYPGATLGNFGQDYIPRAIVARTGLAALPREEAMYMRPIGDGDSLFDGRRMWRISFPRGQRPPVNGFWSLTMYERTAGGQSFFTENRLRRYAIGDRTAGLKPNDDGSLDLWIGHDSPGPERESNWLPAPAGPFTLTLRAYLPQPALLSGSYRLPPMRPA